MKISDNIDEGMLNLWDLLPKMYISLNGCEWVRKYRKTIAEDAFLSEDEDLMD